MFYLRPEHGADAKPLAPAETLSDVHGRPLQDLRISVTDRCNFRCNYCMPAEQFGEHYEFLAGRELLTFAEMVRLARLFASLGARKLRITGGEPLLRPDLPDLVAQLAEIDGIDDLAMTTNGFLLAAQAAALKAAGLNRVTVSLDSLDERVFRDMSGGRGNAAQVLRGIEAAECVGLSPVKINCVVQRGVNDRTAVDLARYFKGSGHIVRFVEYMDVGTLNGWNLDQVVTGAELLERVHAEMPLESGGANYRGEVAERYVYRDGSGEIGVITSVSNPFCGDCTRARLSAEGRLLTCLFAESGTDLKTPMRAGASDTELRDLIAASWLARTDRYSEERSEQSQSGHTHAGQQRIEMYQIGG